MEEKRELSLYKLRFERMRNTEFAFNFNSLTDADCLSKFSFTKKGVKKILPYLNWNRPHTRANQYRTVPITMLCIIFARYTAPNRWRDLEGMFGLHSSQLCEIFWEGLEHFLRQYAHLIMDAVDEAFLGERLEAYAEAVYEKAGG